MQQPGLQQTPAGWPGMPGLQSPLSAQAPQFAANQSPFSPGQMPGQSPFPFPQAQPQQQPAQQPAHGYPGHSYQVQPGQFQPQFQPQPQPQFQPQSQYQPQPQPQYQGQYQAQAQPSAQQPQAAPVPPVSFPTSPYGSSSPQQGQQAGQQGPQSQAQALARQLVELARTLEQLIPGYQMAQSILYELTSVPPSQQVTGADEALDGLRDALYYHGASLGAIRRLLCGEATPAVLINLAASFQSLSQAQTRSRPQLERLASAAPISLRGAFASLSPTLSAADAPLGQAGSAIQGLVGPQIWEAARSRLHEKASSDRPSESGRNA